MKHLLHGKNIPFFLYVTFCFHSAKAQQIIQRNPEIEQMIKEVFPDSLKAYLKNLVAFGTRSTLSIQTHTQRVIGSARNGYCTLTLPGKNKRVTILKLTYLKFKYNTGKAPKKLFQMKFRIILFLFLLQNAALNAQNTTTSTPVKFDVIVSFGSICCGTASDDFLKDYINNYSCKNKDTVKGWLLGGCGREGEYKILLLLNTSKDSKKTDLIAELKKLTSEQNKKNKAVNASSGLITLYYNLPLSQFEYCRAPLTEWNKKD